MRHIEKYAVNASVFVDNGDKYVHMIDSNGIAIDVCVSDFPEFVRQLLEIRSSLGLADEVETELLAMESNGGQK